MGLIGFLIKFFLEIRGELINFQQNPVTVAKLLIPNNR